MLFALALVMFFGGQAAHASDASAEFVKQLRSYCESDEFSTADYVLDQQVQNKAKLIWKCPYKMALRIEGPASMEFIFNGSEAWFFYPARFLETNKNQPLEKVEHYSSLDNRILDLWKDLWTDPSKESRDQARIEEIYNLAMKVENRMQSFSFVPKKSDFAALSLAFALDQSIKIPAVMSFSRKGGDKYSLKMVSGSAKKIAVPGDRVFNPEIPNTKVKVEIPNSK